MSETGPRLLLISDDDDISLPLAAALKRAGYRIDIRGGRDGTQELRGASPDLLILDRDLPTGDYRTILALLEAGSSQLPIVIVGGGPAPQLPRDWHEDAWRAVARPPQPGEVTATVAALLRLTFYRPYRALVHDLSQPVTTLHALSRSLARNAPADEAGRLVVERLVKEAERLMSLMEEFQRRKTPERNSTG